MALEEKDEGVFIVSGTVAVSFYLAGVVWTIQEE